MTTATPVIDIPPSLPYAAVPRQVECGRDGAVVDAAVPVFEDYRRMAVWRALGSKSTWMAGIGFGLGQAASHFFTDSTDWRPRWLWSFLVVVLISGLSFFATAFLVGWWTARRLRPTRLRLDADGWTLTDAVTSRVRRLARAEVTSVEVWRVRRSPLGQLRFRLTTGERIDVGLVPAADLDPVAAELNAALALPPAARPAKMG